MDLSGVVNNFTGFQTCLRVAYKYRTCSCSFFELITRSGCRFIIAFLHCYRLNLLSLSFSRLRLSLISLLLSRFPLLELGLFPLILYLSINDADPGKNPRGIQSLNSRYRQDEWRGSQHPPGHHIVSSA